MGAKRGYVLPMPKQDTNQEAVRNVENVTDSEPVKGEDLVSSEDLKRQFREAKERLCEPSGEQSI
jgi:hypothetical protein